MKNSVLIGNGYWGRKVHEKLLQLSNVLSVQSSGNYNRDLWINADWVFVATPVDTHYDIAKDCILLGKNVFVEKPFTSSVLEAYDLVRLAKLNGVSLYIDNVFLYRNEFLNCSLTPKREIQFIWYKYGPFKDDLFNDLLYHDLYILIVLRGFYIIQDISVEYYSFDSLKVTFHYGNIFVKIEYNRISKDIYKTMLIDGERISFTQSQQDPLMDIIRGCLNGLHDFESNQKLNLQTMELLDIIRKSLSN